MSFLQQKFTRFLFIFFLLVAGSSTQPMLAQNNNPVRDSVQADDDDAEVFEKVEIEASFPGGDAAWLRYLQQNLNGDVATNHKAPVGAYTVVIQFVVDKEGKISQITPLTSLGYGMEEEVIRILKKAPRWKPAFQDGRNVKAYRKQPVTFMVMKEEKKKRKDKD